MAVRDEIDGLLGPGVGPDELAEEVIDELDDLVDPDAAEVRAAVQRAVRKLRASRRLPAGTGGRREPDWVFSSAGRELAASGGDRPRRKQVRNEAPPPSRPLRAGGGEGGRTPSMLPAGESPTMRARRLARFIESGDVPVTGRALSAAAGGGAKAAGKGLLKTLGRAVPYVGGALLAADLASLAYGATAGADAAARAEEAALALDFLEDFGAEADIAREEALVEGLRNIERNERSLALTLAMEELDTQRELGELLVGREQSIARMARVAGQFSPVEVIAALKVLHPQW